MPAAEHRAQFDELLDRLLPLGEVTGKAMFGGFGFWESGDMFALLSSSGAFHFKADESTVARYRRARSEQFTPHMRGRAEPTAMPYWTVPASVLRSDDKLLEWGAEAVAVAHATAKKRPSKAKN